MNTNPGLKLPRMTATRIDERPRTDEGQWGANARHWKILLTYDDKVLLTYYTQGSAHVKDPTVMEVLDCLFLDAVCGSTTFAEFCSDFGYDEDSRKAEKTWKACASMSVRLRKFLGSAYDRLAEHVRDQ